MPNGRCKFHGGKSTGPRTPEGLERSRRANWKHGHFSRESKEERSRLRAALLALRDLLDHGQSRTRVARDRWSDWLRDRQGLQGPWHHVMPRVANSTWSWLGRWTD